MSKIRDISAWICDAQIRISNVKMRYSSRIRISKYDFECQFEIFGPSSSVKVWFACWHSTPYLSSTCNSGRISQFDIRNTCIILTFELGPNIEFWHLKYMYYFDIHIRVEYHILTFDLFFFHIQTWADYRILTIEILFWHSNLGRISHFEIRRHRPYVQLIKRFVKYEWCAEKCGKPHGLRFNTKKHAFNLRMSLHRNSKHFVITCSCGCTDRFVSDWSVTWREILFFSFLLYNIDCGVLVSTTPVRWF